MDTLIVVGTIAMVAVFVVYVLPHGRRSSRASCLNNVRQVGLACRMYSNDNGDQFPWNVPVEKQGSAEFARTPQVWRHFAALSNELNTPKVLRCPEDTRAHATDFAFLANTNISYFVGLDANERLPGSFVSGDRNITGGTLSGGFLRTLTSTSVVSWTRELHNRCGNIALSDGSAQQVTTTVLQTAVNSNGLAVFRLAIP